MTCPSLQYFPTLPHTRHDFRKQHVSKYKNKCSDFLFNFVETFLTLRSSEKNIKKKLYIGLRTEYPLFLSYSNEARIFSTVFRKTFKLSIFMKIRPVGAELFHANRTEGQIWRNYKSLFTILQTRLNELLSKVRELCTELNEIWIESSDRIFWTW